MTTPTKRARLIDTIRKLFALANDKAATAEEAASAAARAQTLLFKHKLSLAEVSAPATDGMAEHDVLGAPPLWQRRLARIVSKHTFCDAMHCPGYGIRFIGPPDDLEVAVYLFTHLRGYLGRAADRVWDDYAVMARRTFTDDERGQWYDGFYEGAVDAIKFRMELQRAQDVAMARAAGTALVRLTDALVQRYIDKKYSASVEEMQPLPPDQGLLDGYVAGTATGQTVPLHKALTVTPNGQEKTPLPSGV